MRSSTVCLFALALTLAFTTPSNAQEKGPDDWKYNLAIYLWGTGVEGTSQIGPVTAPVNITFSDALDNLASVLTVHFEAQKNQWGFLADVMHIGLDPSAALPNGAALNLDITSNIFELGGIYQPDGTSVFQLLFGLRFSQFELEGTIPGIANRTIADESWTDAFIGGRVVAPFGSNENWRFRARADVGAGDSDLVWNVLLGIDYQFSNRVSGILAYRWLDYDYDNGAEGLDHFAYDVRYEGPAAAINFTW